MSPVVVPAVVPAVVPVPGVRGLTPLVPVLLREPEVLLSVS